MGVVITTDALQKTIEQHCPNGVVGTWLFKADAAPCDSLVVAGRNVPVRFARSELGLRAMLADHGSSAQVVLTPLRNSDLAQDVLWRVSGNQVRDVNLWRVVCQRLGYRDAEPGLKGEGLARLGAALLELPQQPTQTQTAGVLTARFALAAIVDARLGLTLPYDLARVLLTTSTAQGRAACAALRADGLLDLVTGHVEHELTGLSGLVAARLLEQAADGFNTLANTGAMMAWRSARQQPQLSIDEDAEATWALPKMVPRGIAPTAVQALLAVLHDAFEQVIAGGLIDRAALGAEIDKRLADVEAPKLARFSPLSNAGAKLRAAQFATLLDACIERQSSAVERMRAALTALKDGATLINAPLYDDLANLAEWVCNDSGTLDCTARGYIESLSRVDVWRNRLVGADLGEATEAAKRVAVAATLRFDERNAVFATSLAAQLAATGWPAESLPVASVIGQVLKPLAEAKPVFVLVLDGLSWAVARQLLAGDELAAFDALLPAIDGRPRAVLAAVPSITEVSRASLLSGKPTRGPSSVEKPNFVAAFAPRSAALFHMGELKADAAAVVGAVAKKDGTRVVGVVINTIDDQLDGAKQQVQHWTAANLSHVMSLINAAHAAGRAIVVASDHGHMLDIAALPAPAAEPGGARWRPGAFATDAREIVVTGAALKAATGLNAVVVPHSERLRYGQGARGYHGGITLTEMVAPLFQLVTRGTERPEGWVLLDATPTAAQARQAVSAFAGLPANPRWRYQRELPGAKLSDIDDKTAIALLDALCLADNRLTVPAWVLASGLMPRRVPAQFVALCALLNCDGTPVVSYKPEEQSLLLNRELLDREWGTA